MQTIDDAGRRGAVWPCPSQPGLTAWSMHFYCAIAHPTLMIRRALLERVGFYPCDYAAEDYALFMQLLPVTRLANVDRVLLLYRTLTTSVSRAGFDRMERDAARVVLEIAGGTEGWSAQDVDLLRRFARHDYPRDRSSIRRLGALVIALRRHLDANGPFVDEDRRAIARDAGLRLLLVSAVAFRRRLPWLGAALAVRALRTSPASPLDFAIKAAKALRADATAGG